MYSVWFFILTSIHTPYHLYLLLWWHQRNSRPRLLMLILWFSLACLILTHKPFKQTFQQWFSSLAAKVYHVTLLQLSTIVCLKPLLCSTHWVLLMLTDSLNRTTIGAVIPSTAYQLLWCLLSLTAMGATLLFLQRVKHGHCNGASASSVHACFLVFLNRNAPQKMAVITWRNNMRGSAGEPCLMIDCDTSGTFLLQSFVLY